MICAINTISMAHQWRKQSAPLPNGALREKVNGTMAAIDLFPMAHQWRNGALTAKKNRTRHGLGYRDGAKGVSERSHDQGSLFDAAAS